MSDRDDDRDALAAEYVLGLLEGADRDAAERRLADDAAFAAAVSTWRTRFAELDATVRPQPAGDALWARIADHLSPPAGDRPVRAAVPAASGVPSRLWHSLAFWRGFSVAATGAVALLLILIGLAPPRQAPLAFVAVMTTDAGRPGAVLQAYADGRVTLIPLEIAPIPQGRALQVWTKPTPQASPVAIGLMDQVRTIRLDMRNLSPAQLSQHFAVSLEPAGGSPTGLPTGPVLLQGDLASAR